MDLPLMKRLAAAVQASRCRWRHATCGAPSKFFTLLVVIAILSGISMTGAAQADVVTFAQFNQQTVADQNFAYTNNATNAGFGSVSQGIPIFLSITDGFAPGLARLQSAHLFLTASTTEVALGPAPPDQLARQHFTGAGNSLQVVLDTPVNGKSNFLTISFSDGLFSGRLNGTEASLKTSDTDSGTPSPRVSFASDFIDFTNAIEHGFSLSFSSVNSTDHSGFLQMGNNGFLPTWSPVSITPPPRKAVPPA